MGILFSIMAKELLLLRRDRAGLLILFLMPAVLVVVITLVQANVMELTGQSATRVVFVDEDGSGLGARLRARLADSSLELVDWQGGADDAAGLRAAVHGGEYQAGLIVPAGAGKVLEERIERGKEVSVTIELVFDPGILAGLRRGIQGQLQMAAGAVGAEMLLASLEQRLRPLLAALPPQATTFLPDGGLRSLLSHPLLRVEEPGAQGGAGEYNPVQQNVPAWGIFGMFFTALAVAGSLLQERGTGMQQRLDTLPVSSLQLLGGKILAFSLVCCAQFLLIALLGVVLFPLLGLPRFTVTAHPGGTALVVLLVGMAVCGYGILLGRLCTSFQQALVIGSTLVVIGAALGGVMVPVYAMPPLMQKISVISPLGWGLESLQTMLAGSGSLTDILPQLALLLALFLCSLLPGRTFPRI